MWERMNAFTSNGRIFCADLKMNTFILNRRTKGPVVERSEGGTSVGYVGMGGGGNVSEEAAMF